MATPQAQPGRNERCPCGSGRRYKQCCGAADPARVGIHPDPEMLWRQAVDALRAGRLPAAERLFLEVSRRQPRNADAWIMLGMLAQRQGRAPEAIARLQHALSIGARSAETRLLLGNVYREAGFHAEAIAVLEDAVRRHPGDAALGSDLGLAYLYGQRIAESVACLQQAITLDPRLAAAHYNLACALERQRRYAEALVAYGRAIEVAPNLAHAHSRMGNLLHAQGRREEALACFRRAAAAAPGTPTGRLNEVKLLMEEEKTAEAEALLRAIVAADSRNAEACRLLGNTLRETGRFDEAVTWLERAVISDRTQIAAYHDLAYSKKFTAADQALVERMRARLRGADLTEHERTLLHFALGKSLDDLGEYAAAIEHFDAGNSLERQGLAFDRVRYAGEIDTLIARFTPQFMAAHTGLGSDARTPVLVLGMPRSGTTLVEQILSSHPQVAGAGEVRFWNERSAQVLGSGIGALGPGMVRSLADDYLALLRRVSPDAARVTDKMPFNFLWVGLIRLVFPNAAIIHCRRDPVDTCLSIYFTRFATRQDFAYDRDDLVCYYRQYQRVMDHWRGLLGAYGLLDVDYEDLIDDRATATRRLVEFLGLDWDDRCLRPEDNARIVKTASLWQARQPVYRTSLERWRRYEPWLGALRELHDEHALRER
ncbi:MAG TPA: sulfotransferase [Casimicrobiaceae bacterium]